MPHTTTKTYLQQHILTENRGNNAFHYTQRSETKAEITIPQLKKISNMSEIQQGKHIVFEEKDAQGKQKKST